MKKTILGIIFLIFLSSYISAQGFYFEIGVISGYADKDYSINYIDIGLKAGYAHLVIYRFML